MRRLADLLLMRDPAHRRKILAVAAGGFLVLTAMGLLSWLGTEVAILAGIGWTLFLISVLVDILSQRDDDLGAIYMAVKDKNTDDGLICIYSEVREVPWHKLFEGAAQVQIVARFFNNIIAEPRCGRAVEGFFSRGGRLDLVVPSPNAPEIVKTLERQRQPDGMPLESMAARIIHSIAQLEQYRVRGAGSGTNHIRLCRRSEVLNYSGFRFDNDLIFAPYEHHYLATMDIPIMHFDLRRSSAMQGFWQEEFSYLSGDSNDPAQATTTADSFLSTHIPLPISGTAS